MTVAVVAVFVGAYLLIATERIHRVAAALIGAGAMVLLGVVDARVAFFSERTGVDWNVIFLLLGMMIIVSVLRQTGVFDFLAIWAAKRVRGRPFALLVMLVCITAVASALLDNVTTVLLIAPTTLLVCKRLGIAPVPFLIAEAMASNIGGMATLVGDPPNIIIASRGGLSFNDFIIHLAPLALLLMVVFVGLCRVMFGSAFTYDTERVAAVMAMREREAITDRRLLAQSLVVLGAVIAGFVAHSALHVEPSMVALLGAGVLVALSRLAPAEYTEEVEWPTLVFFMGLFVMVGGLVETGVIHSIGTTAADAISGNYFLAATSLLWGSAVLGAFFDNIPYVATMAPIVEDIVAQTPDPATGRSLWWAFALGADLGGNGTAVAASANVVVLGIASRHGHPISFWQFTRYGIVTTVVTVAVAWAYVWLRYFT